MYSERLLDHFQNPRNVGELASPAITVEVSNPACGDILRLGVQVSGGRVTEARYKVRGCTASIAAGSALTEMLIGKTRAEVGDVSAAAVEEQVHGLRQPAKGRFASGKVTVSGAGFDFLEDGCRGHRSHVGAGAFGIVGKPHGAGSVVALDGGIQQQHLARGIVDQGGQDFPHQRVVVEGDLAKLVTVQNSRMPPVLPQIHE